MDASNLREWLEQHGKSIAAAAALLTLIGGIGSAIYWGAVVIRSQFSTDIEYRTSTFKYSLPDFLYPNVSYASSFVNRYIEIARKDTKVSALERENDLRLQKTLRTIANYSERHFQLLDIEIVNVSPRSVRGLIVRTDGLEGVMTAGVDGEFVSEKLLFSQNSKLKTSPKTNVLEFLDLPSLPPQGKFKIRIFGDVSQAEVRVVAEDARVAFRDAEDYDALMKGLMIGAATALLAITASINSLFILRRWRKIVDPSNARGSRT